MEVKGCTLEVDGIGYFPDALTGRGTRHLQELIRAKAAGVEIMMLPCHVEPDSLVIAPSGPCF